MSEVPARSGGPPAGEPTTGEPTAGEPTAAEHVYAGYLALQAFLGILLWVGISGSSTVRSWMELAAERPEVTDAFFLADMAAVAGSAAGAWALRTGASWALAAIGFAAGAVVYPTIYLCWWVPSTDGDGILALGLMLAVSAMTCWILYDTWAMRETRARKAAR